MIKTFTKYGDFIMFNEKNVTNCIQTLDKNTLIHFIDGSTIIIKETLDSLYDKIIEQNELIEIKKALLNTQEEPILGDNSCIEYETIPEKLTPPNEPEISARYNVNVSVEKPKPRVRAIPRPNARKGVKKEMARLAAEQELAEKLIK